MPKYLLQLRKTSFFLMLRSSVMSFGSNKASSMAEATWHPMPPLMHHPSGAPRRAWVLGARLVALEAECLIFLGPVVMRG